MVCSYRLMYIHLQFPLDVYGIMKHFNIKCNVFIRPYEYYLFIYKFKTSRLHLSLKKSENKKCFNASKLRRTIIIK